MFYGNLTPVTKYEFSQAPSHPVLESPPEPDSRNLRLLGACVYFMFFFKLVGLIAFPSELRQLTWRVIYPIFPEKELIRGKNAGVFDLGACEVARSLQARLAGSHGF